MQLCRLLKFHDTSWRLEYCFIGFWSRCRYLSCFKCEKVMSYQALLVKERQSLPGEKAWNPNAWTDEHSLIAVLCLCCSALRSDWGRSVRDLLAFPSAISFYQADTSYHPAGLTSALAARFVSHRICSFVLAFTVALALHVDLHFTSIQFLRLLPRHQSLTERIESCIAA